MKWFKVKGVAAARLRQRKHALLRKFGPVMDVVLDIEPVLNAQAGRDLGEDAHHEGELTAAHRLIDRLHRSYGTFIDALVFDALYANGPVISVRRKIS